MAFREIHQRDVQTPSSIGPIGHIETERQLHTQRRKGFLTDVIETAEDVVAFQRAVLDREIATVNRDGHVSRFNIRAVVSSSLLDSGAVPLSIVESKLRIGPIGGQGDYTIVYFGHNSASRSISSDQRNENDTIVDFVQAQRPAHTLAETLSPGYKDITIQRVHPETLTEQQRETILGMLHEHFLYSRDEGNTIIDDPRYVIFAATTRSGEIAGMSMGEVATLQLSNGASLKIVEITNAAVATQYGGNGLYASISSNLIQHLAEDSTIDLIYSESNIEKRTLLNAIVIQQRMMGGVMPNNSVIDNGFRSMVTTFLTREQLDTVYLKEQLRAE